MLYGLYVLGVGGTLVILGFGVWVICARWVSHYTLWIEKQTILFIGRMMDIFGAREIG